MTRNIKRGGLGENVIDKDDTAFLRPLIIAQRHHDKRPPRQCELHVSKSVNQSSCIESTKISIIDFPPVSASRASLYCALLMPLYSGLRHDVVFHVGELCYFNKGGHDDWAHTPIRA